MKIGEICKKYEDYVIEMRRDFHRHPELSKKEKRTAETVKRELSRMGISYETVDLYNVVGRLGKGVNGKTIAIRADMDALPLTERTGLPFASETEGVMHACGHDSHVAMLLGAAAVLKELEEVIGGTVYLCFQTAEEENTGAPQIVEYLKARGGVDQVIGLHIWPNVKEGEILLLPDRCMAGCIGYHVDLLGEGGHGSRPDLVKDPVKAACDLVLKFASIPGNFYDIVDPCVVSTGFVHAGTVGNIFPSSACIEGSCRYFKPGGEDAIIEKMQMMVDGVAKAWGVEGKMEIWPPYSPVVNTPELVKKAEQAVEAVDGLSLSRPDGLIMASENFSEFLKEFPGFFGLLGCRNEAEGKRFELHSDQFDLDERALRKGYEFTSRYAFEYVKETQGGE